MGDNGATSTSSPHDTMRLGGGGREGDIELQNTEGSDHIRLEGGAANAWLGGNGADADVVLFAEDGDNVTTEEATIHLDGAVANLRMGGQGHDGDVILREADGLDRVRLDAGGGNGFFGGNGADGALVLFAEDGDNATNEQATIRLDGAVANLRMGGEGQDGDVILREAGGSDRIRLDAGSGNGSCRRERSRRRPAPVRGAHRQRDHRGSDDPPRRRGGQPAHGRRGPGRGGFREGTGSERIWRYVGGVNGGFWAGTGLTVTCSCSRSRATT